MPEDYRIIIAEDQEVLAALLVRLILRIYPAAMVQMFGDGQDALDHYDRYGADLLLVNHGMPRLDGPTLIRIVRSRGDAVPIIGMSGNPHYRHAYIAAGAMAFLSGPDLLGQLSRLLRRFLPPVPGMPPRDLHDPHGQRASDIHGE